MPQKPNVVAGSSGPLVPLKTKELNAYLRLDTWTLTEALFILNGNRPPGFESTSELISHFMDAYDLAVNSIQSGNLCREIKVAGERRFIESPTRWLSWAERKNLYVAEAVRAEMMLAESVDEKTDAPAQGAPGLAAKSSLNEDRPSPVPISKAGTTMPPADATAHGDQLQQAAELSEPTDPTSSAGRPNRRGRRKGVGGYDSKDKPLIKKMHRLINSGKATSPSPAAHMVVDKAVGEADVPNKVKRLVKRYLTHYSPGGNHSL